MADEKSPFHLVHSSKVNDRIIALADRAKNLGLVADIKTLLLTIAEKLANQPGEWGDPLYATVKTGGIVHRRFLSPLIVRYTLYAKERVVFLWDIRVIPDHPLAK